MARKLVLGAEQIQLSVKYFLQLNRILVYYRIFTIVLTGIAEQAVPVGTILSDAGIVGCFL